MRACSQETGQCEEAWIGLPVPPRLGEVHHPYCPEFVPSEAAPIQGVSWNGLNDWGYNHPNTGWKAAQSLRTCDKVAYSSRTINKILLTILPTTSSEGEAAINFLCTTRFSLKHSFKMEKRKKNLPIARISSSIFFGLLPFIAVINCTTKVSSQVP